ncbi:DUF3887 domain-containing protein [Aminipila sp.]|uniref:DUF3887 domain-containing protein n=1 Tax=Aminipila sp. TaxID=2060095 RepID=UPI0028A2320E|nr:DUF3887 domain-containing protein [Aminipila sp.]
MDKNKYVKSIIKKLKCSRQKRKDIAKELEVDIQIALENGEPWEKIKERMGEPLSVAADFNDNFSKTELKAAKNAKRIEISIIVLVLMGSIVFGIYWMLPKTTVMDNNSSFNEKAVISQAEMIVNLLNENDYTTIKKQYANDKMKEAITESKISEAKKQIGSDWGNFKSYTSENTAEIDQIGKKFAVVELVALYENRSVTYTISFDENMLLAGIYMK